MRAIDPGGHHSATFAPAGPGSVRVRRGTLAAVGLGWAIATILVILVVVGHEGAHRAYGDFVRDPNSVAHAKFYVGFVSLLGLMGWWGGAAVAGIAAQVVGRTRGARHAAPLAAFALFSAYLGVDDALQVHESVLPDDLGIQERATYLGYFLVMVGLVVVARRFIAQSEWWVLALAGGLFVASLSIDQASESFGLPALAEEGTKLFGIVTWAVYLWRSALLELSRAPSPRAR